MFWVINLSCHISFEENFFVIAGLKYFEMTPSLTKTESISDAGWKFIHVTIL